MFCLWAKLLAKLMLMLGVTLRTACCYLFMHPVRRQRGRGRGVGSRRWRRDLSLEFSQVRGNSSEIRCANNMSVYKYDKERAEVVVVAVLLLLLLAIQLICMSRPSCCCFGRLEFIKMITNSNELQTASGAHH